jgi:hypothetical protein
MFSWLIFLYNIIILPGKRKENALATETWMAGVSNNHKNTTDKNYKSIKENEKVAPELFQP